MKSLQIGFVGLVLSVATAWAGPSAIQGVVKDAKGQAIKGADVRIESKDGKQQFTTVKTDAKGGYISQGLPAGVYRVTLTVNGAVKASITNTKTKADQTTQLNFDLKPVPAAQASAGQKKRKAHGLGARDYRQPCGRPLGGSGRWREDRARPLKRGAPRRSAVAATDPKRGQPN